MAKLSSAIDDFGRLLLSKLEAENAGTSRNLQVSPFGVVTALQQLKSGANNELLVANAIVIQNNFPVLPSFLKVIEQFNSKLQNVDFESSGKHAVEEINGWVNEKTRGKIEKLFDNELTPNTRMVLLNAIYFKGKWMFPFDEKNTRLEPFYYSSSESVEVPMMYLKRSFKFGSFDGAGEVVEIPYEGEDLYMLIFLPVLDWTNNSRSISEQFSDLINNSGPAFQSTLRPLTLELHLPRFTIQCNLSLSSSLQQLGIKAAFSPADADFSRINYDNGNLFLADVVHKTMIEVNEEGSVAAAVTGAVLTKRCLPPQLLLNRPFFYAIRHRPTDLTLFMGVLSKP
ncbi:serpin, partial [Tyrophagus putrescentiae]